MPCLIYCGYAILICRVLASLHSAAFTLSQVKRHTVSAIDHPGTATDLAHSLQLHRVYLTPFHPIHTVQQQPISGQCASVAATHLQISSHTAQYQCLWHLYATYLHLSGSICVIFLVLMSSTLCKVLLDGGYGWQYFRCCLCLIQRAHSASSMRTLYHSPHLPLFFLGAAMRGHMVRTAIFVPHTTPVRTICPAAPCEFLLNSSPPLVVCF